MSGAIPGTLKVSNDVIADLAGYAALECYGVVGMAEIDGQTGVVRLLPSYRLRKGIDVTAADGKVKLDLHVIVEQGVNMSSVVNNLTSSVRFILKQIAELADVDVKIHIEGLRVEARQKLNEIRPLSVGQASRISGVSPSDIAVLLIWLQQHK